MRSISTQFYKTKAWTDCKTAYLHSVSGLCEECLKQGIVTPAYIVHHKIHLNDENVNDSSISLNFENLEAVCMDCHNRLHFKKTPEKRYKIVNGELVIPDDAPL